MSNSRCKRNKARRQRGKAYRTHKRSGEYDHKPIMNYGLAVYGVIVLGIAGVSMGVVLIALGASS